MRNLCLFFLLIAVNSCNNRISLEKIGLFVLPEDVWMIEGKSIKRLEPNDIKYPALCFWLDSTKCTPCDYDMLYNFDSYYRVNGELSFFVIVTPSASHKKIIGHEISVNDFHFPIIVDTVGSFYKSNEHVSIGEKEYVYVYLDETGVGHKYVLSNQRMEYDIRGIVDYCSAYHK